MKFKPIALNQNTCEKLNSTSFIKFSHKCKFNGVELNVEHIQQAISDEIKIKDLFDVLNAYNLKVYSIFLLDDFSLSSDNTYKLEVLKKLELIINYSHEFESNLMIIRPSSLENFTDLDLIPQWKINRRTTQRLEDISKMAYKEDINIGFEYCSEKTSSISNLNDAKKVLKPLESQENLGYLIDTFNLAKNNTNFNQLDEIKEYLFLIRLTDYVRGFNSNLERLLPGEGDFNFSSFYSYLRKIKYSKPFSIEISKYECSEKLQEKFYHVFKNM
ncbi:MAG: sugar phosphate isomerase/epimerase [Promethearchaeota archaeon]|nr:MAG: sugar phosphate isomerase/epimerase [Candidatus Lokiarchaeota archaeon]